MKQFTITIKDDKAQIFLDILHELSFIEDIEDISSYNIPEDHKKIVRERIEKYKDRHGSYRDWDNIEDEIIFD